MMVNWGQDSKPYRMVVDIRGNDTTKMMEVKVQ